MRVALYPRVSSHEQTEGYSIGEQIERLTDYCKAMQWNIHKIYTDPGYSGGSMDRPGLQEMLKDIKAGKIDKVVVYKLDRLSRSQKDTMMLIEDEFLAYGVDFVSMSENFDTSTPFGRAMIGILAVFAQLERENIKERTMMGKEARAKEGKWHGGSTVPIGYDYDPATDLLSINEYEAMQVRAVYETFLQGMPLRTMARTFTERGYRHKYGEWDAKTMRRVMRNKLNLGYIKHRNEWYPGDHDPIIDEAIFKKAGKLLDNRAEQYKLSGVKPGAQTTYLGGLLQCKHCGGKYTKQIGRKNKSGEAPIYYTCYSRGKKVKAMVKDPNCKNKNWRMQDLDDIVFAEIRRLKMDPDYIAAVRAEHLKTSDTPEKIALIEKEIKNLDEQISRFMALYGVGTFTIEQVSKEVAPLNEQRAALTAELDALNAENGELTVDEALQIIEGFDEVLASGNFNRIRLTIETLIYYIELDNEEYRIHWKFL